MDYHMGFFIMMMTVFLSYVSFIWIKFGIQKSISASYYALPENLRFLFTLFCWGFAFPAIILGVEITPLMFFAGAGICFVGAAPEIKDKWVYKHHMIFAISGIIFSQLAIYFGFHMLWLNMVSVALAVIIPFLTKKYYFWWIELVAFSAICYALGTTIF
jgi:hypothetical protein